MANNDFEKTRNDFQQYDLVTVFKASETRLMRHLHVATMAVVTKIDGDSVQCMPFPIREGTTTNNIYAYNIGKSEFKEGDKVLVIFTDRDFRKNYSSATTSERSIATTNDAKLHSIDYGVVIPIAKDETGSIEALREKVDNHISNVSNPHNVTKEQVDLGNVVNQGMDTVPTKGSNKYVRSGGVYDSIESVSKSISDTDAIIDQIKKDYTTKDYVDGNFANKYDTNQAIASVSEKATANATEIASIKKDYVTKVTADETYANATETDTKISGLDTKISETNTNLSNTDGKVSILEKSVTDINNTLATKQDNLSFGTGLTNTNNVVTVDFTKVQSKFTAGSGLSFSEGTLSVDTAVIPTIEYLNAQSYGKASDVTKNAEAIADIKSNYATSASIGNGKVVIKQNGTEKGSFTMNQSGNAEINLTDTDTHVTVVNNLTSASTTSALSAYQGNVLNGKISDTNKAVAGKQDAFSVGEGLTYTSGVLAVDTNKFVGYTDYTEKMTSIDGKIATNASSISTLNTDLASLTTRVATNETNISSLNTKVSSNEKTISTINGEISSLDGRVSANEKSISTINSSVSSLDGRVATNEKSIESINTDITSLKSISNSNKASVETLNKEVSSLDTRTTANEKSISTINDNVSSLSKSVEDVTAKAASNASSISSLTDTVNEHTSSINFLSARVSSTEASINTLNSEMGNVYTKSETDNLVNQNIPVVGNRQAYGYWGGGTYSYCLVCKIKIATAWQSTDLRFEYGGNSGPLNTAVIYLSVADSLTSNYSFKIWSFANTNYKFWIKDMGNGEANVYCDITGTQGYLYITRVYGRMLDLHQVTMVMGNAESIPDGAVSTAPYLWADYAQSADKANKATTADTATTATYLPYRRIESFNENPLKTLFQGYNASPWSQKGQVVVPQIAYGNDSLAQFGMIGDYSSGIAWWSGGDMGGALSISKGDFSFGKRATIANYRGDGLDWWRFLVLSTNGSDIASQTVKDFTATEINHGCKFNGDLQSTTKASAPVVEVTDHLVNYNGDTIELPKSSGTLAIVHKESVTYDEIELAGSLYEWFGDEKNKVYNVFLKISGKPLIRMDFNEDKNDFLTADGKSCLDYPDMVGLLYETY